MGTIEKIVQALIKIFVRSNKRFPQGQELKEIERQAQQVLDGALSRNLDEAKGKNLDDIDVMEKTTGKSGDQLIDDYLSNEEIKGRMTSEPPTFTQVDERKLPRADIKALPLKDKEKAEAAVKKKLEAQNVQARQSREGGETPGGPQRGKPELVDETFGETIYIDKAKMKRLMDDAYRKFEAAEEAIRSGNYDEARGILRYEIEDNFKLPQATRDAAYDARIFIRRGEGLDMAGYETEEEVLELIKEKVDEGIKTTMPDNYPMFTNPDDSFKMKNIEYVDSLDTPGEDFGTPNSIISNPEDIDYEFATGGRVKMAKGGITAIKALLKFLAEGRGKKGSELLREVNPKKVKPELKNFMLPDDKKMIEGFRVDYLENILDTIKSDKAAIDRINEMADSQLEKDALFNLLNSGGNRGRFDVYKIIDPDEAILEIEQMIKNLKLKDMSEEAVKRTMNSGGGRVGFSIGGATSEIIKLINKLVKSKKMGAERAADIIDLMNQAKKAGIPIKTMKDLENFEKQIQETGGKVYESRKKYPGVEGEKSGLPVILKGKAPKTNLKKVRSKVDADKKNIKELEDKNQIPVKKVDRKDNAEGGLNYLLGF